LALRRDEQWQRANDESRRREDAARWERVSRGSVFTI
jgi:hypothetical protein